MRKPDELKTTGNKAIEFLNEKYQKTFLPVTYELSGYLSNTDVVNCYTENMDPKNEHVEIYLDNNGNSSTYYDNYFSFYIRPEAEAYIGNIIGTEFDEYKVFRGNEYSALPNELTCDSTLEDLYQVYPTYWMSLKVYVKADPSLSDVDYAKKMKHIENILLESGHRYTIYIFALGDEAYQNTERYTQDDFWAFYAKNKQPDYETYYYIYKNTIVDGGIL